jgi:predicted nucleic acid-binding protein
LSIFVDTSVWFAAAVATDRNNARAKSILRETTEHVTTDHVLVETWQLLCLHQHRLAERFWEGCRGGTVQIEIVTTADLERAWAIGELSAENELSIVDRTSFAVMERLGIARAASFDEDFAMYRYGRFRDRAFEVLR